MCGRYTIVDPRAIASRYARYLFPDDVKQRFNVAPTDKIPGVCNDRSLQGELLEWGFFSVRPGAGNARVVNARSETVAEKPSFRDALRTRRAIVFADGYYEWKTEGKKKRPFHFTLRDNEPFAFAALWNPSLGDAPRTCCFMTTHPNEVQATVHDRSPVILHDDDAISLWLSDADEAAVMHLLQPVGADAIRMREVSTRVNSVRYDDEACLRNAEAVEELTLFSARRMRPSSLVSSEENGVR